MVVLIVILMILGYFYSKVRAYKQLHSPFSPHNYTSNKFAYPTVGMPKPNTEFNSTPVKMEDFYAYESRMVDFIKPYVVNDP